MTTINVTPKNFNYQYYVNDIYNLLDEETKELMIKNVVMSHVCLNDDENGEKYKISELAQSLTNRTKTLPDEKCICDMLHLLAFIYPYWLTEKL